MTPRPHGPRRAFTLVELLIVVGIVALLTTLALVALSRARGSADKAAVSFQLNSIGVALDAYRDDFGDYPRLPRRAARTPIDDGSFLLCRALIAPAPAAIDGADGPGFRERVGSGAVRQPYLSIDKFRVAQATTGDDNTWQIVDSANRPILYYAARTARPNLSLPNGYLLPAAGPGDDNAAFDLSYCEPGFYFQQDRVAAAALLGDTNTDGAITGAETAVEKPYLLWTAGPDGIFGPPVATSPVAAGNVTQNIASAGKCDDVTNFR